MSNTLTEMAKELLIIEEDLSYRIYDGKRRISVNDFELYTFEQVWGSTALGFDGIGGCAMTNARTYVFVPRISDYSFCFVYFGSRFAYTANYSETFMNDVKSGNMESVMGSVKYQ